MKFGIGGNRRRNVLSNPREQFKIIAIFVVLAVLFAGTNYYASRMALNSFYTDLGSLPLSAANRADITVSFEQQTATLDTQLMLFTALSFVVLTLAGVFLSHVIAGPIRRVVVYLEEMTKHDAPTERIVLRRRDFFQGLAEAVNRFQESRRMLSTPQNDKAKTGQT